MPSSEPIQHQSDIDFRLVGVTYEIKVMDTPYVFDFEAQSFRPEMYRRRRSWDIIDFYICQDIVGVLYSNGRTISMGSRQ
ncbi:Hypothetical protein FKW44_003774 [Caligus rogercresseyi]|uniref:Uncharacterized protein n=1 Tax=Caligus rogercresseyi TaxID=217165 RepID=A0A7T8KM79_CALRO|nr:Hypothetical protein FKW44_003774 [Caligus rogercresseyi]